MKSKLGKWVFLSPLKPHELIRSVSECVTVYTDIIHLIHLFMFLLLVSSVNT